MDGWTDRWRHAHARTKAIQSNDSVPTTQHRDSSASSAAVQVVMWSPRGATWASASDNEELGLYRRKNRPLTPFSSSLLRLTLSTVTVKGQPALSKAFTTSHPVCFPS